MDNNIDNVETLQENDNAELIGNKVMNRATQTIGGDNQFILELRDKDTIVEQENLVKVKSENTSRCLETLKMKFKAYKSGKKSRQFDILQMILSAYNNKDQKQGDENQLGYTGSSFKQFDSLQAMKETLPPSALRTFSEFIAKHQIISPSVLPAHIDHNTYSFDWNSDIFNGPFVYQEYLFIEQQQADRPLFLIIWNPNTSKFLEFTFYNPFDKSTPLYSVCIDGSSTYLYDHITSRQSYRYYVNSDGSLGSPRED